ncbi:hypothetical protein HOO65_080053 [Ceratocystis lukuohia]|uniref:Uncharacterized protein n=1 Tax=Ceratocystis lukuohia TaxID=2019550 RepID=A0ABR4MA04_9PEZI
MENSDVEQYDGMFWMEKGHPYDFLGPGLAARSLLRKTLPKGFPPAGYVSPFLGFAAKDGNEEGDDEDRDEGEWEGKREGLGGGNFCRIGRGCRGGLHEKVLSELYYQPLSKRGKDYTMQQQPCIWKDKTAVLRRDPPAVPKAGGLLD